MTYIHFLRTFESWCHPDSDAGTRTSSNRQRQQEGQQHCRHAGDIAGGFSSIACLLAGPWVLFGGDNRS